MNLAKISIKFQTIIADMLWDHNHYQLSSLLEIIFLVFPCFFTLTYIQSARFALEWFQPVGVFRGFLQKNTDRSRIHVGIESMPKLLSAVHLYSTPWRRLARPHDEIVITRFRYWLKCLLWPHTYIIFRRRYGDTESDMISCFVYNLKRPFCLCKHLK